MEKGPEEEIYKKIGQVLRYHRKQSGLSLQQLAAKLEKEFKVPFNPNLLGKVERAESRLLAGDLILICEFYRIDIKQFFLKDTKKPVQENMFEDLIESSSMQRIVVYLYPYKDLPQFMSLVEEFLRALTLPILNTIKGSDGKSLKVASPKKKSKKP
ncbi:XRE family transcriptional regulator [Leptospira semungkisensis]|uniref:XRE family transcriptional regulator n=1 Tax=Leptospira semungkisensis TaxID=2484985 RepID=A0A4R9G6J8_9LEPT|nr:helix-turn-helix transcriptional regulator [Leptospira semungkisensis]TGK07226.1 XRE family transcriptional regulator [Leptospira semungkisensis]